MSAGRKWAGLGQQHLLAASQRTSGRTLCHRQPAVHSRSSPLRFAIWSGKWQYGRAVRLREAVCRGRRDLHHGREAMRSRQRAHQQHHRRKPRSHWDVRNGMIVLQLWRVVPASAASGPAQVCRDVITSHSPHSRIVQFNWQFRRRSSERPNRDSRSRNYKYIVLYRGLLPV